MKRVKHWQDPVNALIGAWLLLSPWVLGFQGVVVATVSTMAVGAVLVASSAGAMQVPQAWEEWLDVMLGVVLNCCCPRCLASTLSGLRCSTAS